MRQTTKDRLIEYALTAFFVPVILAVLGVVLFVSFKYFNSWAVLGALYAQFAFLMVLFHLFRWWQYPGIYESHSATDLTRNVALSILLIWALPIIAILARVHLAGFLLPKNPGAYLGIEFKYHKRKPVQISSVAPAQFRPGEVGVICKTRVIASSDILSTPLPIGTVVYEVTFQDGLSIEVPEQEINREL